MSAYRVTLQPGYVLHSRPYRDTSRLLEIFTADYGRVVLVAKGARTGKSKFAGMLEPFTALLFSWSGQGELHTLIDVEAATAAKLIPGYKILSAIYLNELLMRLLHRGDPHPELFEIYANSVQLLASGDAEEQVLRYFERDLLQETGYGLMLESEADSTRAVREDGMYSYYLDRGPVALADGANQAGDEIIVQGRTLLALSRNELNDAKCLKEAKQLMRSVLNLYLDNRPLKSRELYWQSKNL